MLALLAAATLSLVSPAKWDTTVTKGVAPPAQHVDVTLKNNGRVPLTWYITSLPPWANCWLDPVRPQLGARFTGSIDPGKTAVVRVDFGSVPAAYIGGMSYLDDIAFAAIGSTAREVVVECKLTVVKPP